MRKVVADCETTGLDRNVHRMINVAAIELVDNLPTGNYLQLFLNPDRESDPIALSIHGLTTEFLSTQPRFHEVADQFLEFLGGDPLIAHNAQFDIGFFDSELRRTGRSSITNPVHCTKIASQRKFGGRRGHRLDDLVARFGLRDLRAETGVHGALIDCILLVDAYRGLNGAPPAQWDLSKFGINLPKIEVSSGEGSASSGGAEVHLGTGAENVSCDPRAVSEGDGYVVSGHPQVSDPATTR